MSRRRKISLRLPTDVVEWIEGIARKNDTTVTQIVLDLISDGVRYKRVMADPSLLGEYAEQLVRQAVHRVASEADRLPTITFDAQARQDVERKAD